MDVCHHGGRRWARDPTVAVAVSAACLPRCSEVCVTSFALRSTSSLARHHLSAASCTYSAAAAPNDGAVSPSDPLICFLA